MAFLNLRVERTDSDARRRDPRDWTDNSPEVSAVDRLIDVVKQCRPAPRHDEDAPSKIAGVGSAESQIGPFASIDIADRTRCQIVEVPHFVPDPSFAPTEGTDRRLVDGREAMNARMSGNVLLAILKICGRKDGESFPPNRGLGRQPSNRSDLRAEVDLAIWTGQLVDDLCFLARHAKHAPRQIAELLFRCCPLEHVASTVTVEIRTEFERAAEAVVILVALDAPENRSVRARRKHHETELSFGRANPRCSGRDIRYAVNIQIVAHRHDGPTQVRGVPETDRRERRAFADFDDERSTVATADNDDRGLVFRTAVDRFDARAKVLMRRAAVDRLEHTSGLLTEDVNAANTLSAAVLQLIADRQLRNSISVDVRNLCDRATESIGTRQRRSGRRRWGDLPIQAGKYR